MSDDDHPPSAVLISDRQTDVSIDSGALTALAEDTLAAEGVGDFELSLSFVEDREIAELHERFMDEPGPTDVLSFPIDEVHGGRHILGDVVICPAFAARSNHDVQAEIRLLLVHGILHLLGYDHEEDEERAAMWDRQERYSGVSA